MPIKISPVMQLFAEREHRILAEQVRRRNNHLNMANEILEEQIRDLRHNLYMKEEVDSRRRRWELSRLMHAQEAQRR